MTLSLYNSLTRKKEAFKPRKANEVKLYYCGPTPYNYAHIGNLRAYLFSDFVIRTLRFLGYTVKTLMNVTDIDDKTIRDSQKVGQDLASFTEFYTKVFLEDIERLHIRRADMIAPISTLVDEMKMMIQGLLDKGYAYLADDGSIYYSVAKFEHYGQLAHIDMKGMKASVRINNDEYEKEQVADFALWKGYDAKTDGPNRWEATFVVDGKSIAVPGRPGWHIECSACNMKFFGEQIDIHLGGIDHLFPHHENEIAQTESYTGKEFSKYWMHCEHLLVDNKKMAKSAGNFYTLRDIVEHIQKGTENVSESLIYRGFRLMTYQSLYRESFNFTFDRLQSAIEAVRSLDAMMRRLARYTGTENAMRKELSAEIDTFMQAFVTALEDDFASPVVMKTVFDFVSFVNRSIDAGMLSKVEKKSLIDLMRSWDSVIALFDFTLLDLDDTIPEAVKQLAGDRYGAKKQKDWQKADSIRKEIERLGWNMIDEKEGWSLEKKAGM